jgi:hypothetical protein
MIFENAILFQLDQASKIILSLHPAAHAARTTRITWRTARTAQLHLCSASKLTSAAPKQRRPDGCNTRHHTFSKPSHFTLRVHMGSEMKLIINCCKYMPKGSKPSLCNFGAFT